MPRMPKTPLQQNDAPAHTFESMAEALGSPEPADEEAILEGADDTDLVATGKQIATRHILSDQKRIYSMAFEVWTNATAAQKGNLRAFSKELLAVAVARAQKLEAMLEGHTDRTAAEGASREAREADARRAFTEGLTRRDQAYQVLRGVAGQDAKLLRDVDGAVGTAENGEALAKGLKKLTALGKKFLEHKKNALAKRAKLMRLDADYLESLDVAAKRVGDTAKVAGGRAGGKGVTQGALDREDGVNILVLGQVIQAFEAAHDLDPTLPRLVPIATRRLFGKHRRATAPVETAPATDDDDPKPA
jgi:alkylhydroperoxidase/carboxymuconolactone decarboxylase family protein YurZ